jgi:hypothetical protein
MMRREFDERLEASKLERRTKHQAPQRVGTTA